jgi:hypothetical protein
MESQWSREDNCALLDRISANEQQQISQSVFTGCSLLGSKLQWKQKVEPSVYGLAYFT